MQNKRVMLNPMVPKSMNKLVWLKQIMYYKQGTSSGRDCTWGTVWKISLTQREIPIFIKKDRWQKDIYFKINRWQFSRPPPPGGRHRGPTRIYATNTLRNPEIVSSDAQILILDAQTSSECINLDAQIMILDTQNQSRWISKIVFKFGQIELKRVSQMYSNAN